MSGGGFQPFGYRFELLSKLPPDQLKAKIKSRLKGWFEMKPAPRGWIVGPIICLWHEAFRRGGPVIVATIESNTFGSAIVGRAGFSLFTAVVAALSLPIATYFGIRILAGAEGSLRILFLGLLMIGLPILLLWSSHAYRREADPLVRFVGRIDQPLASRKSGKTSKRPGGRFDHLTLTIDGVEQPGAATVSSIEAALDGLDSSGFLILASGPETYMQVAEVNEEFIIERRDGDRHSHVQAIHADGRAGHSSDMGQTFTYETTLAALLAYAGETPMPPGVAWKKLET